MGTVVLSIDAELAWGFHDLSQPPIKRIAASRDGWTLTKSLLETHNIPATWAIVGHLYLEACDGLHSTHPAGSQWFARDPGTDEARDPLWYGRSLIDSLRESPVAHELACHTFSHLPIGDPGVPESAIRADLTASQRAARTCGVEPQSFIYPRNIVGRQEILAEFGYTAYRPRWPRVIDDTPLRLPLKIIETVAGRPVPIVYPWIDESGLVAIPPSMDIFGMNLPFVDIGDRIYTRVQQTLERLIHTEGIMHLWFHPNGLVEKPQQSQLRGLLELIEEYRSQTAISIETMGTIADRVLADSSKVASPRRPVVDRLRKL